MPWILDPPPPHPDILDTKKSTSPKVSPRIKPDTSDTLTQNLRVGTARTPALTPVRDPAVEHFPSESGVNNLDAAAFGFSGEEVQSGLAQWAATESRGFRMVGTPLFPKSGASRGGSPRKKVRLVQTARYSWQREGETGITPFRHSFQKAELPPPPPSMMVKNVPLFECMVKNELLAQNRRDDIPPIHEVCLCLPSDDLFASPFLFT